MASERLVMTKRRRPGEVRDAIFAFFETVGDNDASTAEIFAGVQQHLGMEVAESSVRSYLALNPEEFQRVSWGRYRLVSGK